jgi:MYXO-CTERM domain-containing protein
LPGDYCAELLDVNVTCDDVEGGSNFFGSCQGSTLRYCDPSTHSTLEIPCMRAGKACGFESEQTGYDCVPPANAAVAPKDYCPLAENDRCDAPEQCPAGTDLLDCNPCNGVSAEGRCDGDELQLCDAKAGLMTTDCAALPNPGTCAVDDDEMASCVPTGASGKDAGPGGAGSKDGGQDAPKEEEESVSCSCRVGPGASRSAVGPGAGLVLALAALGRARRRRKAL